MYTKNNDEFLKNIYEKLINKTSEYNIKWEYYTKDEKSPFVFLNEHEEPRYFPFKKKHLLACINDDYKVKVGHSIYTVIKSNDKDIRFSIVMLRKKLRNKDDNEVYDKVEALMLIFDVLENDDYRNLSSSEIKVDESSELFELYKLATLKMDDDVKIIEDWLLDDIKQS